MPVYTFRCVEHGDDDRHLRVEDRAEAQQCDCGQPMARVFAAPAVKLKGPGFYTTDTGNLDKQKAQGRKRVESGAIRPNADLTRHE